MPSTRSSSAAGAGGCSGCLGSHRRDGRAPLHQRLLNQVVGDGRTRDADLDELVVPIHFIQRYVMANAAARAYPSECRLLGGSIRRVEATPTGDIFRTNEIIGNAGHIDEVLVDGEPVHVEWTGPLVPNIVYVAVGCRRCMVAVVLREDDDDGAFAFGEQHQHGS